MSSEQPAEQTVRLRKSTAVMLVLLFFVALGVGLGPMLVKGFREQAILKNGTDATATIIALRDTRDRVNENPVVELTVEVEAEGLKPYRAQIVTPLSAVDLQSYPVGARVRVRYDPEDPSKVALVGPLTNPPT